LFTSEIINSRLKEKSSFKKNVQLQDVARKYTKSQDMVIDSGIIIGDCRRFRGEKAEVWSPWWLDNLRSGKRGQWGINVWTMREIFASALNDVI
jgi:hypothetical protein